MYSWPKVGDTVRHTPSKRVVKVLRVGDTIDARTANATDAHPDYPNVSPVDLDVATNEDRVRFILAEMKTGKVLVIGNSKNDRKFTVTFEDEPTPELLVSLSKVFASVSPKGKAVDLILKTEQPAEVVAVEVTSTTEPVADSDEPTEDQSALIKELESRIEKLLDQLEDAKEREADLLADLEGRRQHDDDVAEKELETDPRQPCTVTVYGKIERPEERDKFDGMLNDLVAAGWTKFDSGVIPGIDIQRFVTFTYDPRPIPARPSMRDRMGLTQPDRAITPVVQHRQTEAEFMDEVGDAMLETGRAAMAHNYIPRRPLSSFGKSQGARP